MCPRMELSLHLSCLMQQQQQRVKEESLCAYTQLVFAHEARGERQCTYVHMTHPPSQGKRYREGVCRHVWLTLFFSVIGSGDHMVELMQMDLSCFLK